MGGNCAAASDALKRWQRDLHQASTGLRKLFPFHLAPLPACIGHFALEVQIKKFANMAAPGDQRVAVPIDDPNADTEWYA